MTDSIIPSFRVSKAALLQLVVRYYWSVTLPSLIVASYGGGTGLPTQRECLEVLGCYGTGKADKLAEIVAATVLAGDVSLGSAVLADEWVTAHEQRRAQPALGPGPEAGAATMGRQIDRK